MKNKRVYGNQQSLEGERVGQFDVLAVIGTYPLRYEVKCSRCNCVFTERHDNLIRQGKVICKNTGCGVAVPLTAKSYRAEQDAEISKLIGQYERNSNELARVTCENLRRLPDDEFIISRDLRTFLAMPHLLDDPRRFTEEQLKLFLDYHPTFETDENNAKVLTDYLLANGVGIPCDFETFDRAFCRLYPLGMLRVKEPAPLEPKPGPQPVKAVSQKPVSTKPLMVRGIDPDTGLTKDYSQREVDRMDSDTYRRSFFTTAQGLSKRALNLVDVLQGSRL
jgi:hypothetical protein